MESKISLKPNNLVNAFSGILKQPTSSYFKETSWALGRYQLFKVIR